MKALLINPPIREWARPNVLPLGLGYIASVLRDNGHEVEVMDINAHRWTEEEVDERISRADFDVAGIGAIVTVYRYVKWLSGVIKKHHPEKKLIIGGSVGTSIPHLIFDKTGADIVCVGEGEATVVELFIALAGSGDIQEVAGIWFRDADGAVRRNRPRPPIKDLDSIPFPAWDRFPMDIYVKNPVGAPNRNKWVDGMVDGEAPLSMNISGTRGCPYKCIYCYHDFMGSGYRHRSPGNVISEMRALHDGYGVEYFHFIDDEFCLKKEFVRGFCSLLKKEFKGRVTWGCVGRVNLMTEDLIAAMADAGCVSLGYGIESGSQKMLDAMKKGVTVEQAKEAVRLTKKHIGWADCSFMVGTPGESMETIRETIDFCKEMELAPQVVFFVTPYPGTELYRMALQERRIVDEEEYVLNLGEQGERMRVNFSALTDLELAAAQGYAIRELDAKNKLRHPEGR